MTNVKNSKLHSRISSNCSSESVQSGNLAVLVCKDILLRNFISQNHKNNHIVTFQ